MQGPIVFVMVITLATFTGKMFRRKENNPFCEFLLKKVVVQVASAKCEYILYTRTHSHCTVLSFFKIKNAFETVIAFTN